MDQKAANHLAQAFPQCRDACNDLNILLDSPEAGVTDEQLSSCTIKALDSLEAFCARLPLQGRRVSALLCRQQGELVWVRVRQFTNEGFYCQNQAEQLFVSSDDVVDWMTTENNKLVGGEAIRLCIANIHRKQSEGVESFRLRNILKTRLPCYVKELGESLGNHEGFFDAIGLGDLDRIRFGLEEDPSLASVQHDVALPNNGGEFERTTCTALEYAVWMDQSEAIQLLVDFGVETGPVLLDRLLLISAKTDSSQAAKLLLDMGANVNACSETSGKSAIYLATSWNAPRSVSVLLDYGADQTQADARGLTPIFVAEDPAVIEMLISAGADPNQLSVADETPLTFIARCQGDISLIKALINAGGSLETRNGDGVSAHELISTFYSDDEQSELYDLK